MGPVARLSNQGKHMNHIIERIYREQRVIGPKGEPVNIFPDSIRQPEGEAIYKVVREENARSTLEVGMAWGLSTLYMCQALKDNGGGRHVAIDPFQAKGYGCAGVRHVQEAGLGEILEFHEEPSQLLLPQACQRGPPIRRDLH